MGIKRLCKFLHDSNLVIEYDTLDDFMNKHYMENSYMEYCKLGIDSSIYIRRYMQVHGKYYTLAILKQSFGFLLHNVIPVYIFDGKPPKEKNDVLQQRSVRRIKNKMKLKKVEQQSVNYNDNETYSQNKINQTDYEKELLRIRKQLIQIHNKDIIDVTEMLNICNIPYIKSTVEADSTLGELYRQGYIDAVLSYDMDLLLKGCNRVISFTPGGHINEYNLNYILDGLKLTYEQFVDMCILFGSEGVPQFVNIHKNDNGVTIHDQHDIYELIVKYHTIENIIDALYSGNIYVSNDQITDYLKKCDHIRSMYNDRYIELVDKKFTIQINRDIDFGALYIFIMNTCIAQKMMIEGKNYDPNSNVPFMTKYGMLNVYQIRDTINRLNNRIDNGLYHM